MSIIKNTKWQMIYQQQDPVELPEEDWLDEHGGSKAYKYKSIPPYSSDQWVDAPVDSNGKVHFAKKSRLPTSGNPNGYKKGPHKLVDFTYFRTTVTIPAGARIDSFKVTINKVDDGARVYLFNNKDECKDGYFDTSDDVKYNGTVTVDFTDKVLKGNVKTIVIVQFDDCPVENRLTGGIDVQINDETIETDTELKIPEKDGIQWSYYWATDLKVDPSDRNQAQELLMETNSRTNLMFLLL
jgi:hypothetical protein